ncbi:unnamed protein product [Meganyctiphanes norvegica]|uniref:Ionotropic glutamate receptor C-terminal domain-containing protein n=1 Tax=Meganyctiphanes norvegica TaxID=48144 RepID=A0AAV2RPC8_MEGNR
MLSYSSRIIVISTFASSMLLYNYYTSNLISTLTVNRLVAPFTDLHGIHAEGSYTMSILKGTAIEDYFKRSTEPLQKALWQDTILSVSSDEEGMNLVLSSKNGHLVSQQYFANNYQTCSYMVLPGEYFRTQMSWALPINSQVFPIFNHALIRMNDVGIISRVKDRWLKSTMNCENQEVQPMALGSLVSAFFLLALGIAFSLAILITENIRYKLRC